MKIKSSWLSKLAIISIIFFMVIMWSGLGRNYLFDWDEGIYATIGREMKQSGEILTPTWNGDIWLEKPPVIAWVTSLGMTIAGENELGARLFMPLFAGLTLYAVYRLGEIYGGTQMGIASMAILGYFNLFLARARAVNTDGMLLAAITWTVYLLAVSSPPWMVGIIMGLAIMVKGPAGILAILISLPLLVTKSKKYLLESSIYLLATIVPWHLYVYLTHGTAFTTPYLLEQVIRRATVPIEFHTESRWFYLDFLYKDLGIGVLLVAILGVFASSFVSIWWVALPLLLFTLAKTRLSWYILPIYPGLALLIGAAISSLATHKKSIVIINILVVGMLVQMLFHAYTYVEPSKQPSPLPPLIQIAKELSQVPGDYLAMLVSPSERVAEAILPKDQAISSSFRYGGAPSVVWYSHKHIHYYYNYLDFGSDVTKDPRITTLIVSSLDVDKVPLGFKKIIEESGYIGYTREASYALR